jgi:hypothetical protein
MGALYPRLLGSAWQQVAASVRRIHLEQAPVHAVGIFCVQHGGRIARCLAWLLRLPSAGEGVETHLHVTPHLNGERWHRTFAGRLFVTSQYECGHGLLAERVGLAEIRFRLEIINGGLVYQQTGVALALGRWRVPLPRWLAPRTVAREVPGDGSDDTAVQVEVDSPLIGPIISYNGILRRAEAITAACPHHNVAVHESERLSIP